MRISVKITTILIACTSNFLAYGSAQAGPCTTDIAQFESVIRQSGRDPDTGLMAQQTIGAQLGHQPTPSSVKRAEERAQTNFAGALARAKRLDARGNRSGCKRALAEARRRYELQ
jgi:hypothetical protein